MDKYVNTSVSIYKEVTDADQEKTTSLTGAYLCWVEEGAQWNIVKSFNQDVTVQQVGRGTVFLWDDVDLEDSYLQFDGKRHDIFSTARLVSETGFDHIEVVYK